MSVYFSEQEMKCRCQRPTCDAVAMDPEFMEALDTLRERVGRPLRVTSGARCAFWNAHEGGQPDSAHLTGQAADLEIRTSPRRWEVVAANFRPPVLFTRLGIAPTFVHVDAADLTHATHVLWLY